MKAKYGHPMMPQTTHDEYAQQRFLLTYKSYVEQELDPLDKELCNKVAVPVFEKQAKRKASQSQDVRSILEAEPFHQFWLASLRDVQELMWDNVGESVDRQLGDLIEGYESIKSPIGSLRLNPDFEVPDYITAFDHHRMPGSYYVEVSDKDLRAGALFDRSAALYHVNRTGGYLNAARGTTVIDHVLERCPDLEPKRILDMGCTVGHSTITYCDQFPEAEVYAIDLGAPILRYAHARAEKMGKKIHFSQQNAENTDFEDGFFDLIVSTAVLHETSRPAMLNIFKECHRLLSPEGIMVHLEVPARYEDLGVWEQVRVDWETQVNNEPFIAVTGRVDYLELAEAAGFEPSKSVAGYQWQVPGYIPGKSGFTNEGGENGGIKMGSWCVCSAIR